jgi:hypothetical protein
MRILNPKLIQVETEKSISYTKVLLAIIVLPLCTAWMVVLLPLTKGKKLVYKQAKELGNAWNQ